MKKIDSKRMFGLALGLALSGAATTALASEGDYYEGVGAAQEAIHSVTKGSNVVAKSATRKSAVALVVDSGDYYEGASK